MVARRRLERILHPTYSYLDQRSTVGHDGRRNIRASHYGRCTAATSSPPVPNAVLQAYVFEDEDYKKTLELIDKTSQYALTGAMYVFLSSFIPQAQIMLIDPAIPLLLQCSFSSSRAALLTATNKLRNAAGNVYYNEKCTGAVVGQQPFGGARASGTNDKAGSISIYYRFVSARSIKENFVGIEEVGYPSNLV